MARGSDTMEFQKLRLTFSRAYPSLYSTIYPLSQVSAPSIFTREGVDNAYPIPPSLLHLLSGFCQIVSRQRNTVEFIEAEEEKIDTEHVNTFVE